MKNLYGLVMVGLQQVGRAVNNGWDYVNGNYAAKKDERIKNEEYAKEVLKAYKELYGDAEIELAESYSHFNRTTGPDSLAGTA